jgi:ankyrin repeat protein
MGWPLLHVAIMNKNLEIADQLIVAGAKLDVVDNVC